jgi:hypothetical protein
MDTELKLMEKDKNNHEETQGHNCATCDGPADACAQRLSDVSGTEALPATGHSWWRTIGAAAVVVWVFAVVLFYMIRFVASVGDAGARGIYGL